MEFYRQEYWSRLPVPPLEDLSHPGIETLSLASLAVAGGFFVTNATWEVPHLQKYMTRNSVYQCVCIYVWVDHLKRINRFFFFFKKQNKTRVSWHQKKMQGLTKPENEVSNKASWSDVPSIALLLSTKSCLTHYIHLMIRKTFLKWWQAYSLLNKTSSLLLELLITFCFKV